MEDKNQKQLIEALRDDIDKKFDKFYEVIGQKLGHMHSGFATQLEAVLEMN